MTRYMSLSLMGPIPILPKHSNFSFNDNKSSIALGFTFAKDELTSLESLQVDMRKYFDEGISDLPPFTVEIRLQLLDEGHGGAQLSEVLFKRGLLWPGLLCDFLLLKE